LRGLKTRAKTARGRKMPFMDGHSIALLRLVIKGDGAWRIQFCLHFMR